jgi:hypothetical protein
VSVAPAAGESSSGPLDGQLTDAGWKDVDCDCVAVHPFLKMARTNQEKDPPEGTDFVSCVPLVVPRREGAGEGWTPPPHTS